VTLWKLRLLVKVSHVFPNIFLNIIMILTTVDFAITFKVPTKHRLESLHSSCSSERTADVCLLLDPIAFQSLTLYCFLTEPSNLIACITEIHTCTCEPDASNTHNEPRVYLCKTSLELDDCIVPCSKQLTVAVLCQCMPFSVHLD
jgi:hypothetical protein